MRKATEMTSCADSNQFGVQAYVGGSWEKLGENYRDTTDPDLNEDPTTPPQGGWLQLAPTLLESRLNNKLQRTSRFAAKCVSSRLKER